MDSSVGTSMLRCFAAPSAANASSSDMHNHAVRSWSSNSLAIACSREIPDVSQIGTLPVSIPA